MSTVPANDSQTTETPRVASPVSQRYTLLAVQQGEQWASLCRELDIASCGATAEEALDMLERAIADALRYERDTGVGAGQPVPRPDWEAFEEEVRGSDRVAKRTVTL
jgi:predicted RNase H-like HicB family nuclease